VSVTKHDPDVSVYHTENRCVALFHGIYLTMNNLLPLYNILLIISVYSVKVMSVEWSISYILETQFLFILVNTLFLLSGDNAIIYNPSNATTV